MCGIGHRSSTRPVASLVRGDALAIGKYFHDRRRRSHLDAVVHELVWHAVVPALDVDAGRAPLRELVAHRRQQSQDGSIKLIKCRIATSFELLKRSSVQFVELFPDGLVQLLEAEESPTA